MNPPVFVPIVEGQGEVAAIGPLIRRVFEEAGRSVSPVVQPAIRVKSSSFLGDAEYFGKYVRLAAAKAVQFSGKVLILLDCEDDCPATLGPRLLAQARAARADAAYLVVLAHREFETWFIAAAGSLSAAGFLGAAEPPADPTAIRGAKEWLGKRMAQRYDPIIHQVRFVSRFSLDEARAVASFSRFTSRLLA